MPTELSIPLLHQFAVLLLLALPVACISWTVTHEEVFREPREACKQKSETAKSIVPRKFFYLFTCEYCFSHYVTVGMLILTGFKFLLPDWRGYLLAGFSLVWIANMYMSIYALIKIDIKKERAEIEKQDKTD